MPNCTHKQVTRFYYRGKGYGSKLSAYKSAAKEDLLTQVFGASSTFECAWTGQCYVRMTPEQKANVPNPFEEDEA